MTFYFDLAQHYRSPKTVAVFNKHWDCLDTIYIAILKKFYSLQHRCFPVYVAKVSTEQLFESTEFINAYFLKLYFGWYRPFLWHWCISYFYFEPSIYCSSNTNHKIGMDRYYSFVTIQKYSYMFYISFVYVLLST